AYGRLTIALVQRTDARQRRQASKAVAAEALHRAAFLIHADRERLVAQFPDGRNQRRQLFTGSEVAREQDRAADLAGAQTCTILRGKFQTFETDDQHDAIPAK